jgi:hypothetical protein
MVTIEATRTLKYKYFDRFSKFVLIGNDIDGFITIDFVEFKDFEDVKKRLKKIIETVQFRGQWDLKFFEVADNYEIEILHGYYKVLKEGNLLFAMNPSQNIGDLIKLFVDDSIIHFHFLSEHIECDDNCEEDELKIDANVVEHFLTIFLFDKGVKIITDIEKTFTEKYIMDDDSYLDRRGAYNFFLLENDNYRDYSMY